MNEKGCQLVVSPCSVSPSLNTIRRHQSQTIGTPVSSSPQQTGFRSSIGRTEKANRGSIHSLTFRKQNEDHVVLPNLSLRRKVLTYGKTGNPQQMPTYPLQNTTMTTSKNVKHLNSYNYNIKGKNSTHCVIKL
ncbi:hypothetical protein ILYODFUR_003966 [Ilyodon furcidens]|uniref:Uncharacterized protein n=1 Tax=Ilyodon furcidens TaxID=33524 RepID=A0ABV0VDB0_9TELE